MKTDVTFILAAEIVGDATGGLLLGEFNNWDQTRGINLTKTEDGSLQAVLALEAGVTYQYRYLLDDERWVNDESGRNAQNCTVQVALPKSEVHAQKTPTPPVKSTPAKQDDLTKIEGVGKKIAEILIVEQVDSFERLANSTTTELRRILDAAGNRFKMYDPTHWPKQARLAQAGKWEELKRLQLELKNLKK